MRKSVSSPSSSARQRAVILVVVMDATILQFLFSFVRIKVGFFFAAPAPYLQFIGSPDTSGHRIIVFSVTEQSFVVF